MLFIPASAAGNVTIKGVDFEIPDQYDGGILKDSSYVYKSGLTFRILSLDDAKNLRINFGDDFTEALSHEETTIEGHDAVVIHRSFDGRNYTTVYTPIGDKIFLICFNDTYVNDDISKMISKLPSQNMTHDDFSASLNTALSDFKEQVSQEKSDIEAQEMYKEDNPINRFFFFRFNTFFAYYHLLF